MSFITSLMSALSMLPNLLGLIDQVVVNVEQGLGNVPAISGSQKLAAAEAKVNSLLSSAITDAGVLTSVQTLAKPLINAAVTAFNAAGLFTHKTTVTSSAPVAPVTPAPPATA